jgi:GT2 family glycosyltransferase
VAWVRAGGREARRARTVVVTVNYRTPELAEACLASLAGEVARGVLLQAVVVDNASADGSYEQLVSAIATRGWERWAQVVASPRNGGFGAGNNLGVRTALAADGDARFFLFLNPDAEVLPGAIRALEDFFDEHPSAGIAGSRLRTETGDVFPMGFRFPNPVGELVAGLGSPTVDRLLARWRLWYEHDPALPCRVDWVAGAAMAIRREVIDAIGPMDEGFFLWFEEPDISRRALQAGWTTWSVPQSEVQHVFGGSTGVNLAFNARMPHHWFESRRRYYLKHHGRAEAAIADMARIVGTVLGGARCWLRGHAQPWPPGLLRDLLRHSVFLRPPWRRPTPPAPPA